MSNHILTPMTRGDHSPAFTFTLSRPGEPALDLTEEGTAIKFMARRSGQKALLFTKTIGDGVEVTGATTCIVTYEPADTAILPEIAGNTHTLELELEVTEADGRITTPWHGTQRIRNDFG
jgi:hypothetical protein